MYEDWRCLEQEIFRGSVQLSYLLTFSYILGFSSQKYKTSLSLSVVRVGADTDQICYDLGGVGERPSISPVSHDSWLRIRRHVLGQILRLVLPFSLSVGDEPIWHPRRSSPEREPCPRKHPTAPFSSPVGSSLWTGLTVLRMAVLCWAECNPACSCRVLLALQVLKLIKDVLSVRETSLRGNR